MSSIWSVSATQVIQILVLKCVKYRSETCPERKTLSDNPYLKLLYFCDKGIICIKLEPSGNNFQTASIIDILICWDQQWNIIYEEKKQSKQVWLPQVLDWDTCRRIRFWWCIESVSCRWNILLGALFENGD